MARDDGKTAALVGGGIGVAALLWWLLRGGVGGGGGGVLPGGGLAWARGAGASRAAGGHASGGGGGGRRCRLRLSAHGLTVDGEPATIDEAAARCTDGELVVTGDALQGDLDRLRAALAARGRPVRERLPWPAPPAPADASMLLLASMRGPRRW
jgi:hypothetical protein